jgi:hypothetical protein
MSTQRYVLNPLRASTSFGMDERVLTLQNAVVWFIAPLAIVTVAVSVWREFRKPTTALPEESGK